MAWRPGRCSTRRGTEQETQCRRGQRHPQGAPEDAEKFRAFGDAAVVLEELAGADVVAEILDRLTPQNYEVAVDLASIPEHIRGYGHVKDRHLKDAKVRERALLAQLRDARMAPAKAAVMVHAS